MVVVGRVDEGRFLFYFVLYYFILCFFSQAQHSRKNNKDHYRRAEITGQNAYAQTQTLAHALTHAHARARTRTLRNLLLPCWPLLHRPILRRP